MLSGRGLVLLSGLGLVLLSGRGLVLLSGLGLVLLSGRGLGVNLSGRGKNTNVDFFFSSEAMQVKSFKLRTMVTAIALSSFVSVLCYLDLIRKSYCVENVQSHVLGASLSHHV